MKLSIFQSDKGDCLLLEAKSGELMLCDGGMAPSMRNHVRANLESYARVAASSSLPTFPTSTTTISAECCNCSKMRWSGGSLITTSEWQSGRKAESTETAGNQRNPSQWFP